MTQYIVCIDGNAVTGVLDESEAEIAALELGDSAELVEAPEPFDPKTLSKEELAYFEYCLRGITDPSEPNEGEQTALDSYRSRLRVLPHRAKQLQDEAPAYKLWNKRGY